MRRAITRASWAVVALVVGAAMVRWLSDRPDLEPADARTVAVDALAAIDREGTVSREVVLTEHTLESGETVEAWVVFVDVDGDEIELRVQTTVGQLVWVDDNIGDGKRLLTDEEFDALDEYRDEEIHDRWVATNVAGSVGAGAIALVGYGLATRSAGLLPGAPPPTPAAAPKEETT